MEAFSLFVCHLIRSGSQILFYITSKIIVSTPRTLYICNILHQIEVLPQGEDFLQVNQLNVSCLLVVIQVRLHEGCSYS